jgi:hypothetical protein
MGKRELLLIVAFLIVGAVVYQATAPPPGPNERSISISGILEKVRREMRGNRSRAEETRVTAVELDPGTTEIRIAGTYAELTITGENRRDMETKFRVTSNGYDDAEAKELVGKTQLKVDDAGSSLRLESKYPEPGSQRAWLTLLVPANMKVRIDGSPVRTTVVNVAGLEIAGLRGETSIKQISGRVSMTHRGGRLTIDDVAALKLTARGSAATVSRVHGEATFSMQSGELSAMGLRGQVDVEASVRLEGLANEARVDGRNTEIEIEMARPAAVTVSNDGGEPIEITPPSAGFTLDAVSAHGRVLVPDELRGGLTAKGSEEEAEHRANGAVRGGGPTLTLRSNHGEIRILSPDGASDEPERPEKATPEQPKPPATVKKLKGRS